MTQPYYNAIMEQCCHVSVHVLISNQVLLRAVISILFFYVFYLAYKMKCISVILIAFN